MAEPASQPSLARALPPRSEISAYHLRDEASLVGGLVERAVWSDEERRRVGDLARRLVTAARQSPARHSGVDAFMQEYALSSEEGVILMCLAEALLRIPDAETADALIAEKLASGDWERHLGQSDSLLVNASTWGLMLTGRLVRPRDGDVPEAGAAGVLRRLVARTGEPVIRQAVRQAVKLLGDQFVLGRTIKEAISRAAPWERRGCRLSYDMLGEAARTADDAERYFKHYLAAIEAVGKAAGPAHSGDRETLMTRPGLSVKLSALHHRFEPGKDARLEAELLPRLIVLARAARESAIGLTIDAEEQDRLDPTLAMLAGTITDPALAGWDGLGIAVQAYGKRAMPVLRWLRRVAEITGRRIPLRLVKGAYWDSEVKWAQEKGLADYPVLTRKLHTDVSFLAGLRYVLAHPEAFYPQIATHNAHTIAAAHVAAAHQPLELQRLHGMGEAVYDEVLGADKLGRPVRIYAPVGVREDLVAYLVRRLIENGANTSFVHRLADPDTPLADIVRDPVEAAEGESEAPGTGAASAAAPAIPRPPEIYAGVGRRNSLGLALAEPETRRHLLDAMTEAGAAPIDAGPIIDGRAMAAGAGARIVRCPHDLRIRIGSVLDADATQVEAAIARAVSAQHTWDRRGGPARAAILDHAADLLEADRARLMAIVVREAGKTLESAQGDLREAVDFLRYYAGEARRLFSGPALLPGPTGERNTLDLRGRGAIACISPWNFPLAIFIGQVAAALAAGNTVLAKPAEQTPLTAFLAVGLLHRAGVPPEVLHLLPGDGSVGAALVRDPRVAGIVFTGSTQTAWAIQRTLADRRAAIVPFIAETGGLNAMIADSSALPEQIVRDAVRSAYDQAGQRCSAARVLLVQDEIADATIAMLKGAVAALDLGDPWESATDIGPVIDEDSVDGLEAHKMRMRREARELVDLRVPEACRHGSLVGPALYEIERLERIGGEVFGPILHVARFSRGRLGDVITALNATGYGLTLGLHSRIAATAEFVAEHARVGNLYVNRHQIGAVVGVQPFGGEGLSGTGPKAGGPHYLLRLASERVRSTDVTATGGNAELLGLRTLR